MQIRSFAYLTMLNEMPVSELLFNTIFFIDFVGIPQFFNHNFK